MKRLTKEDIKSFLKEYDTPEKAQKLLKELKIIDENGNLTEFYRDP